MNFVNKYRYSETISRGDPPTDLEVPTLSKGQIKRVRKVQHPELDTVLYGWLLGLKSQAPKSGDLIKEKAAVIFTALYPTQAFLRFSNRW